MPPDLNSLPPSRPSSGSSSPLLTPHSPLHSHSLAAAATMNAGIHNESQRLSQSLALTPLHERRRSSIRANINLNDPNTPGPGELAQSPRSHSLHASINGLASSPDNQRAPSLGQLHQQWENEQESQVNRLLNMIRAQQAQIQSLSSTQPPSSNASAAVLDDSTPTSEQSFSFTRLPSTQQNATMTQTHPSQLSRSPALPPRGNSLTRHTSHQSHASSRTNSPALRPISSVGTCGSPNDNDWLLIRGAGTRDENALNQAETTMLRRENQMLRVRIGELERRIKQLNPTSPVTHTPVTASNLAGPSLDTNDVEAVATGNCSDVASASRDVPE